MDSHKIELELKDWSSITILEYLQIMDIIKDQNEDTLESVKLRNLIGIISILSGIDINVLMKMDIKQFNKYSKALEFMNTLPKSELKPTYEINGIVYKVQYDMNKISTEQYIDMLTLAKGDFTKNMHKILSLFLIPTEEKKTVLGKVKYHPVEYGSYNVEEVANILLENLTVDIAYELMVFFYQNYENLMIATLRFLIKKIKKLKNTPKEIKAKLMNIKLDGDGLQQLTELHKELTEIGNKYGL